MSRLAKIVGYIVFAGVELVVLFGSYVVASVRCCTSSQSAWPAGAAEWVSLAIFAVVMVIPAALIALGAAMLTDGVRYAIGLVMQRGSPNDGL